MAKLDNMLSKITLKSHGHESVCLPACLSIPNGIPSHICQGVAAGQECSRVVWESNDDAEASLIAVDWYQSTVIACKANSSIGGCGDGRGLAWELVYDNVWWTACYLECICRGQFGTLGPQRDVGGEQMFEERTLQLLKPPSAPHIFGVTQEYLLIILAISSLSFLNRILNRRMIMVSPTDTGVSIANWECSAVSRDLKILSEGNCVISLLYAEQDRIAEVGSSCHVNNTTEAFPQKKETTLFIYNQTLYYNQICKKKKIQ